MSEPTSPNKHYQPPDGIEGDKKVALDIYSHIAMGNEWHEAINYNHEEADFYHDVFKEISFNDLPGVTPLEKANSYAKIMQKRMNNHSKTDNSAAGKMRRAKDAKNIANGLHEWANMPGGMGKELFMGEEEDIEEIGLSREQQLVLDFFKSLQHLKTFPTGIPKKKSEPTMFSDKTVKQPVESMKDLMKVPRRDLADPLLSYKVATGQLSYDQAFKEETERRRRVVLVDRSGSMCNTAKISMLKAIMMYMFEDIENSVFYISDFLIFPDHWVKIETKQEAIDFYKALECKGGGSTQVSMCINEVRESLKQDALFGAYHEPPPSLNHRNYQNLSQWERDAEKVTPSYPILTSLAKGAAWYLPDGEYRQKMYVEDGGELDIIVINDGQDPIDLDTLPDCPVHALTIEETNPDLQVLTEKTGGTYNELSIYEILGPEKKKEAHMMDVLKNSW